MRILYINKSSSKQARFTLPMNLPNSFATLKLELLMSFFWKLLESFFSNYPGETHLLDITCLLFSVKIMKAASI